MKTKYTREEMQDNASFLLGFAAALKLQKESNGHLIDNLFIASRCVEMLSNVTCSQGFICKGGNDCQSDHK